MRRKVRRLQRELNRPDLRSCYDTDTQQHTPTQILLNGIVRPLKMLFFSPIIFLLSLYMSVAYGLLYLLFTTITQVFIETYGWDPDICGLAYIGLGIGFLCGLVLVARLSDATVVRMTKANDGKFHSIISYLDVVRAVSVDMYREHPRRNSPYLLQNPPFSVLLTCEIGV
jgi:hypothetical protein